MMLIVGLRTNICDRHTSTDAFHRGYYGVAVAQECVEAFTDEDHRGGLEYLKMAYGARIVDSEELARQWEAAPVGAS